jgi:uncharacterized protein (UPF0264 family)
MLQLAIDHGVKTFLVDTYDKSLGSLLEFSSLVWLREFSQQVHEANLAFAIAGSLRLQDVPVAIDLLSDILAVRTAACERGRDGEVSVRLVRELRQALSGGELPGKKDSAASDMQIINIIQAHG